MKTDNIVSVTLINGGGTFDPKTGDEVTPRSGFAVGGVKGTAFIVSVENPDLIADAAKIVARRWPGTWIGTWVDGDSVHIDPVVWIGSREVAEHLGRRLGQKAIYNFATGEEVTL